MSATTTSLWARGWAMARSPSAVYLAASALGRLGSIFLIPLYTRRLSQEAFGTISLANTMQSLLALVLSGGLVSGLSKVYFDTPVGSSAEGRVGVIARGLLTVVAVTTTVSLGLAWLLWPASQLFGLSGYQIRLVLVSGAGAAASAIPDVWYRSRRLAWWSAGINLSTFLLTVAASVVFVVVLERGADGVLEATALVSTLVGGWGVLFTLTVLRAPTNATEAPIRLLTTIRFSLPFIPHFISSWLFSVGDRWALASLGAQSTLGVYALGQQLASPLGMVASAVNEVEVTHMGQAFQSHGLTGLQNQLPRALKRYLLASAIPAVLLVVSIPILAALLGPHFQESLFILPVVALAGVIDSAYYPPINVLFFASRTTWIPVVTTVTAVLTLAFAAALTVWWGLWGLALARVVSSLARVGLALVFAKRALGTAQPVDAT
jgi:O-antigen/teichoic acid export membrane protein